MFFDSGIAPQAVDNMSMYELNSMFDSLKVRRGGPIDVPDDVREEALSNFAAIVAYDPTVVLN